MPIPTPYFRISRPSIAKTFESDTYVLDSRYSNNRSDLIRSYHILEKELFDIFEYIEPSQNNKDCFSHQIYGLLLRACTEFEANAKGILQSNGYNRAGNFNITDYHKLNSATKLSEYEVKLPIWNNGSLILKPFENWAQTHMLSWYSDYNSVKHDRFKHFEKATLFNAINAVAAVFCIVYSQFNIATFSPYHKIGFYHEDDFNFLSYDNCRLAIKSPSSWLPDEKYEFNWSTVSISTTPFQQYQF